MHDHNHSNNEDLQNVELEVQGMTCNSCAMSVQKVLEKGGAKNVQVNYATHEAKFVKDENISIDSLIENIEGLGYKVVKENTVEKKNS